MQDPNEVMVWLEAPEAFEAEDGKLHKPGRYWARQRTVEIGAAGQPLVRKTRYSVYKGPDGERLDLDVTEEVHGGYLSLP